MSRLHVSSSATDLAIEDGDEEHFGAHRVPGDASCSRVILIGELNPVDSDPRRALDCAPRGGSGHRLQDRVLALAPRVYRSIWRANLCVGDWILGSAVARARDLLRGGTPWMLAVLLGCQVSEAASRATGVRIDLMAPASRVSDFLVVVAIPHPSGLCRTYNDPAVARRVRRLLAEVEPGVPWGQLISDDDIGE